MRFEEMPQSILSNTEVYALFASYLTREYKQEGGRNSGDFLAYDSVLGYFGSIMNQAKDKFKATGTDKARLFFTCVDSDANTEAALWYKGLMKTLKRELFERSKVEGEVMDQSATSLFLSHIRSMVNNGYLIFDI